MAKPMPDVSAIIEHFNMRVTVRELLSYVEAHKDAQAEADGEGRPSGAVDELRECAAVPVNDPLEATTPHTPGSGEAMTAWPSEVLPPTKYSVASDLKSMSRREEISQITLRDIKPGKLAMLIHCVDLLLVRSTSAADLVVYDGTLVPQPLAHMQNKNTGVLNWLGTSADLRYLFRMMTHAVILKNYNLLNILIECAQRSKLDRHCMKKLLTYKRMCDRMGGGVFPFGWLLKDCADSNVNVASEIASMRFCKIVDCLKAMKEIPLPRKISERQKHFIYSRAWEYLNRTVQHGEEKEGEFIKLYLLL